MSRGHFRTLGYRIRLNIFYGHYNSLLEIGPVDIPFKTLVSTRQVLCTSIEWKTRCR
jgi:hypothetical protein